jgi:hypothetical protein
VHSYRLILTGSHTIGLGNGVPLTGTWQPDARNLDPNLETGTRDAFLSNLNGSSANGQWSLFVADVAFGETHTLANWSLEISGVPEVRQTGLIAVLVCLLGTVIGRRKRDKSKSPNG